MTQQKPNTLPDAVQKRVLEKREAEVARRRYERDLQTAASQGVCPYCAGNLTRRFWWSRHTCDTCGRQIFVTKDYWWDV